MQGNGQDIRLGEVIERVRKFQPGMLCADRTIGGPYENYVTPEQCVPERTAYDSVGELHYAWNIIFICL